MKNDILKVFGAFLLLFLIAFTSAASVVPVAGKVYSRFVIDKNEAKDLSLKDYGIQWAPDGHISYVTFPDGVRRYFISGNQRAYVIETKANVTLEDAIKSGPVIKSVFGPDISVSYRNNYATIAEVLQTDSNNPYHLFALTQYEEQLVKPDGTFDYSNFTASIGLLESLDGGLTWKDLGQVIKGDDYLSPGTRISGAGEPSAIIKDGYVYVYYVDWSAQTKTFHPDQIYLARTKIVGDSLSAFEFLTTSGFSPFEANLQPVITPPSGNAGYASLPSVSFNKYLNQYMVIYETNVGFVSQISTDGISWKNAKTVLTFNQPQSERKEGSIWYSYPTLLSDNQEPSDQTTQKTGNLYLSSGIWPNVAHQPAKKTFELQ